MKGYWNRPELTAQSFWTAPDGKRFIDTGDIGKLDSDGFLVLQDRKKDLIISGEFNIFPSDLEQVLSSHPDVADAAVVGAPSEKWGEAPVAFVVLRSGAAAPDLLSWTNERVGKIQCLSDVRLVDSLPRNAIGKVLKRELREAYAC